MAEQLKIGNETIIRDIVSNHPRTIPVFEEFKLDYCCGGGVPLEEAAESGGISLSRLLKALKEAIIKTPETSDLDTGYNSMSNRELVNHIVNTYHSFLRTERRRHGAPPKPPPKFSRHSPVWNYSYVHLYKLSGTITPVCFGLVNQIGQKICFPYENHDDICGFIMKS